MAVAIPAKQREAVRIRDLLRCVRCFLPAHEWHHRRSRSVVDDHRHCTCNGIYLCTTCHQWAHAHPFDARKDGYIVSRSVAVPGEVPMNHVRFGTITLTCDGLIDIIT